MNSKIISKPEYNHDEIKSNAFSDQGQSSLKDKITTVTTEHRKHKSLSNNSNKEPLKIRERSKSVDKSTCFREKNIVKSNTTNKSDISVLNKTESDLQKDSLSSNSPNNFYKIYYSNGISDSSVNIDKNSEGLPNFSIDLNENETNNNNNAEDSFDGGENPNKNNNANTSTSNASQDDNEDTRSSSTLKF